MDEALKKKFFNLPTAIGLGVILLIGMFTFSENFRFAARGEDNPPEVDFTWSPLGKVTLEEMVGHIHVKDDYMLDFKTFEVRVVELNRTLDILRDDVIGMEYEDDISFAIFHNHPVLLKYGRMTLEISIADDQGQETKIERVVKLKVPEGYLGTIELETE